MDTIVAAKVQQGIQLLREFDLPLWIVQFGRETYDHPAPVQHLTVGTTVTWPAAFILTAEGRSIAIVGTGDVQNVQDVGVYQEVIGYVKDIGPVLRRVLDEIDPARIALSYSVDDDQADNMTHGMFLVLQESLRDTPYAQRLESADRLLVALRARKLPVEVKRIEAAIEETVDIFAEIERMLRPGVTEREVADAVHRSIERSGLTTAWDYRYDPVVNFGPESKFGHAGPGDLALAPGMLVHVDLGVKKDGYCSDLQRMWYLRREGETQPPEEVLTPFATVVRSMQAGFEMLRPGIAGWEVDAAARAVIVQAGYDEPEFALGHQIGQSTHDGGGLLGPRWPRYGNRPNMPIEEGNVFTLEYALPSPAGIIGLEEDVLVTADGARYLSPPQTELNCL
jgi:Xaa-Pro aminopeptidase